MSQFQVKGYRSRNKIMTNLTTNSVYATGWLLAILTLVFFSGSAFSFELLSLKKSKDFALAKCINELASKNHWLTAKDVTKITCHGKGIQNLDDLTPFVNLKALSLFNNKISKADLRAFTQLTSLNIANNKLSHIQVTHLSQLHTLYLFKNQLTTLNFSGLSQLKKLRITNNKLFNIDISELASLEKAYFFDNKLEDLSLTGLEKLKFIELRQNPMPDEVYDRYDELEGITIIHDGNADDWK